MRILDLALSIYCVIASAETSKIPLSNGLEDNVITSVDLRQWVVVNLPEQLLSIDLDDLHLFCNNGSCKAKNNETIEATYVQIKDGGHYQVSAQFGDLNLTNYFRIGWEIEEFGRPGRKTLLTQFIVPANIWPVNNKSCIQPRYSLPLIRSVNESSQITVRCTIRKSMCLENESIVIFDLNKDFCVYNETVKTCNKTEENGHIVHYTTTVSNTFPNKYFPDHYVFCNSNGSYISTRITWNSDQLSTIIEENTTTTTWTHDDQCSCPSSYDTIELPSCKRDGNYAGISKENLLKLKEKRLWS
ncbi:hypothetical protein AAHC03_022993 [Spirometra sp. Aus1]